MEQKEATMGLEVRQSALFDREEESPDGLLEGERRERLVLLVAEMIRQAAVGRRPDGKGAANLAVELAGESPVGAILSLAP